MARKDFGAKPYTYPQPVFILATYNEDGTANAMNAAWGGISEGNEISFCISAGHKTTKNFQRTGAFTVSMADAKHVAACDYVGIESANNVAGKLDKAGFTVTKSANVDAPIINELAVCAECKVKSYDPESCRLVAEIVNVSVDEAAMTDGKVDVAKVQPITLWHPKIMRIRIHATFTKNAGTGCIILVILGPAIKIPKIPAIQSNP
jgi:flavin reductase (DIM6/NTAB) family NADH-FMN oxidoreductase RutF